MPAKPANLGVSGWRGCGETMGCGMCQGLLEVPKTRTVHLMDGNWKLAVPCTYLRLLSVD